jgi:hypothetical protein
MDGQTNHATKVRHGVGKLRVIVSFATSKLADQGQPRDPYGAVAFKQAQTPSRKGRNEGTVRDAPSGCQIALLSLLTFTRGGSS